MVEHQTSTCEARQPPTVQSKAWETSRVSDGAVEEEDETYCCESKRLSCLKSALSSSERALSATVFIALPALHLLNSGGGSGIPEFGADPGGYFGPGSGFNIPGFGGGWGAGYGGPTGGYSRRGVVRPSVVCSEKGPCYKKRLTCPAKCFSSFSHSGKGYGSGGGGGGCTIDCKKRCVAYC
ncbi:hypothetical protein GW17_00038366 [Ensete ventricosum]|nr:hypothetical protein GW17_00038366 [Ensete ventricosum]